MSNDSYNGGLSQFARKALKWLFVSSLVLLSVGNAFAAETILICSGKLTEISGPLSYLDSSIVSEKRAVEITENYRFVFSLSEDKIDQLNGRSVFSSGRSIGCSKNDCFCNRDEKEQVCYWKAFGTQVLISHKRYGS